MTRQGRGQTGADGYKELINREKMSKRKKDVDSAIKDAASRSPKNKELMKLRKQEEKLKTKDPRSSKYIHPRGSGRQIKGRTR